MVKTVSQLFSLGNDPVQIIAQLIGFAGAVTYFLVFQMKKRKSMVEYPCRSNFCASFFSA